MLAVLLGILLPAGPTAAQEVQVFSNAAEIELTGRIQLQARTSSCSDFPFDDGDAALGSPCAEQVPGLDMFMRRVRFAAEVTVNDFISAKVEPDFGDVDAVELKDAWGRLTFSDAAKLQIGQFKRPFDGFELTSSSQLLTVERDVDVPGVPGLRAASLSEFTESFDLSDRDIGAMFFGAALEGRLEYWVGAFNGAEAPANADANTDKQFVGRARYTFPVELSAGGRDELPLSLAAAAAFSDLPVAGSGDQAGTTLDGERFVDFELWAELGDMKGGPHVQAGMVLGDNPGQAEDGRTTAFDPAVDPLASLRAWQVVGTYRFGVAEGRFLDAVEPVLRVTRADPNTDLEDDENWAFTPGINVFFDGRNKLQVNGDVVTYAGDTFASVSSLKTQFQVYF